MNRQLTKIQLRALEICLQDPNWPGLRFMEDKRAAWRAAAAMSLMTGNVYHVLWDGTVREWHSIFRSADIPGYPRPWARCCRSLLLRGNNI